MPLQKGSAFPHFLLVICLCRMKEAYMAKMPMLRSLNCFSESKYNNQDIIRNRFTIYLQVSKKNYFLSSWEHCNKSFSPGNKSGRGEASIKSARKFVWYVPTPLSSHLAKHSLLPHQQLYSTLFISHPTLCQHCLTHCLNTTSKGVSKTWILLTLNQTLNRPVSGFRKISLK